MTDRRGGRGGCGAGNPGRHHRREAGSNRRQNDDRSRIQGQNRTHDASIHRPPITGLPPPKSYLSKEEISKLASADSRDIIRLIATNEDVFLRAFEDKKCGSYLKQLIKILYKSVKSSEEDYKTRILARIFSDTYALFCHKLNLLIQEMTIESDERIKAENVQYLDYLIDIGMFIVQCIPSTIHSFPHPTMKSTIDTLKCSKQLVEKMDTLNLMVSVARIELTPKRAMSSIKTSAQPPDDFRNVDILPQPNEINSFKMKPFLRSNIVEGPYENWEHYLDIQYRLLREDFVGPLRSGICSICNLEKTFDIHLYENVKVVEPVCLLTGLGFQLKFDSLPFQKVHWEHSKRLIYGSLLCLSNDDFHNIIFVTVVNRDPAMLTNGFVTVKIEGTLNNIMPNPETEYVMVESTAYFEAYRHILGGLKKIEPTCMPFQNYIVSCKMEKIPSPCYLRAGSDSYFNIAQTLGVKDVRKPISVIDIATWPPWNLTCLDESQLHALQTALCQDVSLIQGPPGTGKTFIGLKIVEVLLLNRLIWDKKKTSPILVVCYTNHALDQFLEGIKANWVNGKEPSIVRIGGRCKSEKLKENVLSSRVKECRDNRFFPKGIHKRWVEIRKNVFELKDHMDTIIAQMNKSNESITELHELLDVISETHVKQLQNSSEAGKEIHAWLGLWYAYPGYHTNCLQSLKMVMDTEMKESSTIEDHWATVDEEACLLEDDRMSDEEKEYMPPVTRGSVKESKQVQESLKSRDDNEWTVVQMNDHRRKQAITNGLQQRPLEQREAEAISDVQLLPNEQRWMLYRYWLQKFHEAKRQSVTCLASEYDTLCQEYSSIQQECNLFALGGADVIGMTTTGASKHHQLLQKVSPKIIIVEEAAEVFEAHVITSLSPSVQQLIMIGDHQQLKPNPNNYALEKDYNFNVSLFERLINNKMPYVTLNIQHRMRPEIASLIHPHIYRELHNSPNVEKYEHIRGIGKNLFLIDHSVFEDNKPGDEMYSHVNVHEAKYVVGLCHHLLKQGYLPSQITILTMYRGQLLEMKHRMKRADFEGVRVAVVDDYQGEENDIILLSLVRSNPKRDIGFLKNSNRICVSLSRAKMGFYIIGNFNMLRHRDDTVWPKILIDMEQKQYVGTALPLYCQNHPEKKTLIQTAEDFSNCPEGGCNQKCQARLNCGHTCQRLCHPYDKKHEMYKCTKKCNKILACGHYCIHKCFDCSQGCKSCSTIVPRVLQCGHTVRIKCGQDPLTAPCPVPCGKKLPCCHLCQEKCSQPCTIYCCISALKELPCGHKVMDSCHKAETDIICNEPCSVQLDCGHQCLGTCAACHSGRLHVQCSAPCTRTLPCGHICNYPCTSNCPPCNQQCSNGCIHSTCPKKCHELCDSCTEECPWQCVHLKCTKRCGELCDRIRCNEPCTKRLKCKHPCIGLCGEKCPTLCRVCDEVAVTEIFFGEEDSSSARFVQLEDCNHIFEVNGLDQWMDITSREVQFKACPKCNTIIRRHLRYGNVVKNTLTDMECIKMKQLVIGVADLKSQMHTTFSKLEGTKNWKYINEAVANIREMFQDKMFPQHINAIQNQIVLLPQIVRLHDIIDELKCEQLQFQSCIVSVRKLREELQVLQAAASQFILLDQQIDEIHNEFRRLLCFVKLCDVKFKLHISRSTTTAKDESRLSSLVTFVQSSGMRGHPVLTKVDEKKVEEVIKQISQTYGVGCLSDAERNSVVKAIGLNKGHWFKCPNGHFYCIGECGGAMEEAKCPECGMSIGGQSHNLAPGNELASEMDGALYPAWSNAANLANQ